MKELQKEIVSEIRKQLKLKVKDVALIETLARLLGTVGTFNSYDYK